MRPSDEIHPDDLVIVGEICCHGGAELARGTCDEEAHGSDLICHEDAHERLPWCLCALVA